MDSEHRRAARATAAVGYGAVAAGALTRAKGIRHLRAITGDTITKPHTLMLGTPTTARGVKSAKVRYLTGTTLGTVGGIGASAGTQQYFHKQDHRNLLSAGIQGNVEALQAKVKPPKKITIGQRAAGVGLSLAAGTVGSRLGSKHIGPLLPAKLFPAVGPLTGTAAAGATLPITAAAATAYQARKRKAAKRPSAGARTVEARSSRGADPRAARQQIVPVGKASPDAADLHVPGQLIPTGKKGLRRPPPYELQHGVRKSAATGMTPAQARAQLHRRKRKLITDVASTGLGLGGLALLGASNKHVNLPKPLAAKLSRAATTTAVLGGGVGSANAIQGIGIAHRDLKAQDKVLAKAFRMPGYRSSYLQTRRLRTGILKPVRVNGGLVR